MKVKEMIQWLQTFPDQEAEVEVVEHSSGSSYYEQGGTASTVAFNPAQHADYVDFRGNQFVKPNSPHFNTRTLLLGKMDA